MYETKQKKYVYTVYKKNEAGYTFASLLLTLGIVMIMMPIIMLLLQLMQYESDDSHVDAQHFFEYLHQQALVAKRVDIDQENHIIRFHIESSKQANTYVTASIEQYENKIRRRVSGQGYEVYIQHVADFKVTDVSYGFHVMLIMENGEEYEKTIEQNTTRK